MLRASGPGKMMNPEKNIKLITDLMERDDSVDAPADSIKWAKNIFRARVPARSASIVERVIAVLTADLSGGKPVFGERSASSAAARQMLFEAGEAAVDLRITIKGTTANIRGQVIGSGFENAVAVLSGDTDVTAELDADSGFEIAAKKGIYSLTITGPETEIVIDKLDLA